MRDLTIKNRISNIYCCFAWLICFCGSLPCYARTNTIQFPKADSLKQALSNARSVNDSLKLRYAIGIEDNIYRVSFWDSLVNDAARHRVAVIEVKALDRLGYSFRAHGKTSEAMASYNKSIAVAEKNGLQHEAFYPLRHIAGLYFTRNEIRKSLDYCYKCLKTAEAFRDHQQVARTYTLLGDIYFRSGQSEKALKFHHYILKLSEQYHLHEEYTEALLGLGTNYRQLNDTPHAVYYYRKAATYLPEFGDIILVGGIYNAIGASYELSRQPDSATGYYQEAYELAEKVGFESMMASSMILLAQNSFNKGDYKKAEKQALKTLDIVNDAGFKGQIPMLALLLKDIYEKKGDHRTALKYYALYAKVNDSVTNERMRKEALEKQYEYNLEKKENTNKLLAQQNQIQLLEISKGRYRLSILIFSLLLLSLGTVVFFRQSRIKAVRQQMLLEQKLLRSQMNPHFIFNSLQAIQNFMLKQDEKQTAKYLSSFADLARHVLESSRLEYVQLRKEIALLNKYLELQKLRFGNRFNYYIHIDEAIDEALVPIPPMLCQPFIENAVEHGMKDVADGGIIKVSYTLSGDMLHIEIADNGKGMDAGDHARKAHQSAAIEITKERIELMNKKGDRRCGFEITEAFPLQDVRKGVKVVFNVPLNLLD